MKQGEFTILSNRLLAPGVYEMVLSGDTSAITAPGQFVQLSLPGFYLRRPISVCDCDEGRLTLVYKVVGRGTDAMAAMEPRTRLDLLTGLGNGYRLADCGSTPLLLGGGAGVPPMFYLAKQLIRAGAAVTAVLGFNTAREVFYEQSFRDLGAAVIVTTADGSYGHPGFVTDAMDLPYSFVCACGPLPMLKAVWQRTETSGAFSFEERMGCGFGACMGCSIQTKFGAKRVCKDGPVFRKEEILW